MAFHSGREADHSPPSSIKECVELYLHSPNTPSWRGAQLGGAQGQLYHIFQHISFKIHHNITLPSMSQFSKRTGEADVGWWKVLPKDTEANSKI
jgi:hypothetical protein